MTDRDESSGVTDEDESSRTPCPVCGQPIAGMTIIGPTDGIAAPCGCRVPPRLLSQSD